jgi:hypothetical protein
LGNRVRDLAPSHFAIARVKMFFGIGVTTALTLPNSSVRRVYASPVPPRWRFRGPRAVQAADHYTEMLER